jgi:crotonobetainyl-CoA:carnitine CoA-transferase CaiB-like acyl-CoA transferase
VPGDLATRKLAELGADVVKLEDAGTGDPVRLIPPFLGENSVHHWNLNRAKRSVAADLRTAEGKALFHALADKADAIVEVSVPGRFEKLGIDFAAMRRQRPQLVICSITGFGQTGPWSTLPSHGMNMDALAGNVILTQRNGYPAMDYRLSSSVSSELGAMNAALAVSASIFAAREGRGGCWIDISCWDAGFEMHRAGIAKQMSGLVEKDGPNLSDAVLYAPYLCSDGRYFIFCAIEQKFWDGFCDLVGRPDLKARWEGLPGGVDYRIGDDALRSEMAAIFAQAASSWWFDQFLENRIPGCVLLEEGDLPLTDHVRARRMLIDRDGSMPRIADPILFASHDVRAGEWAADAPGLDAHRSAVLRDWLGEDA